MMHLIKQLFQEFQKFKKQTKHEVNRLKLALGIQTKPQNNFQKAKKSIESKNAISRNRSSISYSKRQISCQKLPKIPHRTLTSNSSVVNQSDDEFD